MPRRRRPVRVESCGRRLAPLREEGVLIIGSGFMTYALSFLRRADWMGSSPTARVVEGQRTSTSGPPTRWRRGDVDTFAACPGKAPGMPYAHPMVDHYVRCL
jgi:4,5-DOPA dioxygenase extradiol